MAVSIKIKDGSPHILAALCLFLTIFIYGHWLEDGTDELRYASYELRKSYANLTRRIFVERKDNPPMPHAGSSPIGNVVYIKTHKTGSTTVQSIIYRYGLSRNLSFVVRRTNPHNGHVRYMKVTKDSPKKMFLPIISDNDSCVYSGYNLSAIHVVHKKEVFETFMNPGTKYITILRNPVSQLMSAFRFFSFGKRIKGNSTEEKLRKYFDKPAWKHSPYARNSQIFDLGLPKGQFDNDTMVNLHINRLDSKFDLVLIHEYFEESIVLLGRELCWDMDDLVYTIQNNRSQPKQSISEELSSKIKSFNRADWLLYEHFNRTLWMKIEAEGSSFWSDLEEFRQLQEDTMLRCFIGSTINTRGMPGHDIKNYCDRFAGGLFLFEAIFKKQNKVCSSR